MIRMFDVNVNGIIRMTRAVAPTMRRHGSGRIVNIGSIGGKLPGPANGSYSASKYAVEGLSDSMRMELVPFGIDVILVEPGGISTNFARSAVERSNALLGRADSPYAWLYRRLSAVTGSQRANDLGPDLVAQVVLKALRAPRPRPRYTAGVNLSTRLLASSPDAIKDRVMSRRFQLERGSQKQRD